MTEKYEEYLFVDGYKVINAWPELVEAKSLNLEAAREKLIDIMADYAAQTGINVIIVFDAHQVEGGRRIIYRVNGVEVVFTKEGETADNYIEKTVDSMSMGQRVRVATSDWIEQQIVMGRGAIRVSARELHQEIKDLIEKRRKQEERRRLERHTLEERIDKKIWSQIIERLKNGGGA